ncbi:MAG: galactose mutarotase [Sphingobacteriales bacterium]|nr:MAG: galactose mutarotase [Sphingobacteriales bacterium]
MPETNKQTITDKITSFVLKNNKETSVQISNLGACITKFCIKNANNQLVDVVLAYDNLDDYCDNPYYLGVTVGPYANRIAKGRFNIDGVLYQLAINNGPNNLHSGATGIHNKIWTLKEHTSNSVLFSLLCPHLEDGFPGNVQLGIKFELNNNNELCINYSALSDKKTIVNLTNHAYFNLNGHNAGTCTQHLVKINAHYYTPIASDGIPTGEILPVKNTPFDFTRNKTIQADIDVQNQQLTNGNGYDHNFVVDNYDGSLQCVAQAIGDKSNISLEVFSTLPGLQFYVGSYLDIAQGGKNNASYPARSGFCFETQHLPNSVNQPNFPSTIIEAGKQYNFTTVYKLSS